MYRSLFLTIMVLYEAAVKWQLDPVFPQPNIAGENVDIYQIYSPLKQKQTLEQLDVNEDFDGDPKDLNVVAKKIDEQTLFIRAFGHAPDLAYDKALEFKCIVEREEVGNVYVELRSPLEHSSIKAKDLVIYLEQILLPRFLNSLKQQQANGYIPLSGLQQLGLQATIDVNAFKVIIDVPVPMKKTRVIGLRGKGDHFGTLPRVQHAPFTGFINMRAADNYTVRSKNNIDQRRSPIQANLDGAVNINDYILEASGSFTERDPTTKWRIGDVRVIHDLNDYGLRLMVGDLNYETKTFQSFEKSGGVTVANNFHAKGIRNTSPSGSSEFVLMQPSKVEVYVNEQLVLTRELTSGRYNIQDFPLTSGVNDVRVVITDPVGKKEELYFPFFYNFQLLAPGLHDFSYSLGMPSSNINNRKKYNGNQITFSGFHRLGITDNFTGGVNLQHNKYQYLVGLEGLWETPIGTLQPEFAMSKIFKKGTGRVATVQYTKGWGPKVLSLRLGTRSDGFASLGTLDPNNLNRYEISARYSFPLPWNFYGGISTSYQLASNYRERTHANRLNINKRLMPGVGFGCSVMQRKQLDKAVDYVYMANFNIMLSSSRSSFNVNYDLEQKNTTVEWDHSPVAPVHSLGGNLRLESSPIQQDRLNGSMSYNFNRLETTLNYNTTSEHNKYDLHEQQANIQLGTGLAFAQGHVAFSRPVANSFVMVAPVKKLKGHPIDVEPVGDNEYETQANRWGPGVVPSLSEYQQRIISLDDSDFPIGQELAGNTFVVSSKYKTGTLIEVGTDSTVLLQGRLLDRNNVPISKLTVALVPKGSELKEDFKEEELFFTGKHGFFAKQGIKPGEYSLVLFNLAGTTIPVVVPEEKEGIFDLGTIVAPTKYEK